jgi:hypothetical protein
LLLYTLTQGKANSSGREEGVGGISGREEGVGGISFIESKMNQTEDSLHFESSSLRNDEPPCARLVPTQTSSTRKRFTNSESCNEIVIGDCKIESNDAQVRDVPMRDHF